MPVGDLFGLDPFSVDPAAPLADRMRPRGLSEFAGQDEAAGEGSFLAAAIREDRLPSLILWGPPGSGKTTLARIVAHATASAFAQFSAVLGGVQEVRQIVSEAQERRKLGGRRTILFVDELHRFNRAQQDAFLPHVENGTITLIGATTENPSFEVNAALLSRCRVVRLRPLPEEALVSVLMRALSDAEHGLGGLGTEADNDALALIARCSDGDARQALNLLEEAVHHAIRPGGGRRITAALLAEVAHKAPLRHDRSGDSHYDLASAFIKSMRGSDPDAAMYYAIRLIEAGDDPLFVLRRIVIFASEDVGNADPRALQIAISAHQAFERVGVPEGLIPLAQAVTYCATAPKSNASYLALAAAQEAVKEHGTLPVPLEYRNAPTRLMREMGAGEGYRYPHEFPGGYVPEHYLPEELRGRRFYEPKKSGYEERIAERVAFWRKLREK
jgi:putative ATPase